MVDMGKDYENQYGDGNLGDRFIFVYVDEKIGSLISFLFYFIFLYIEEKLDNCRSMFLQRSQDGGEFVDIVVDKDLVDFLLRDISV